MKNLFFGLVCLVALFSCDVSASISWTGESGSWSDPTLWNAGIVPDDTTEIKITKEGGVCTVDTDLATVHTQKISIASGPDSGATLEIVSGGVLRSQKEIRVGALGTTGAGDLGYLNMTGGELALVNSGDLILGYKAGTGAMTISGGMVSGDGDLYIGGNGADGSVGTLTISGADAALNFSRMYVGAKDSSGGNPGTGTIAYEVGAAGVSPIRISGTISIDSGGDASTSALLVTLTAMPTASDILLIDGDVDGMFDTINGIAALEGAIVSLDYDGAGYDYSLSYQNGVALNYIPEPISLLLLGLGGALTVRRRN